ncbi:MAG: hypothetical protein K6G88_13285 [Lachnospiraceae bacterium]|nr:hypothetical protein [Lachnospiraceae bacterium]
MSKDKNCDEDINSNKEILGKLIDDSTPKLQGNERARANYKEIEVTNASDLMGSILSGLFIIGFLSLFTFVPVVGWSEADETYEKVALLVLGAIFGIIELIVLYKFVGVIFNGIAVRLFGKNVTGMICRLGDEIGGGCEILVRTSVGYRCFKYSIDKNVNGHRANDLIGLRIYNNSVLTNDIIGEDEFTLEKLVDGTYKNEENSHKKYGSYVSCIPSNLNYWNSTFYFVLGFFCVLPFVAGLLFSLLSLGSVDKTEATTSKGSLIMNIYGLFFLGLFLYLGILLLYLGYDNVVKNIKIQTLGASTTGKICSCERTGKTYNHRRGIVYKILIFTPEGGKYIKYDMESPAALYKEGEIVNIKVYQNYVTISKRVDGK